MTDARVSAYERRRRAPLHFEARASNAMHCARVLVEAGPSATYEGFAREASIALELIVKAVIAQRLEVGEDLGIIKVPVSHNVPQLWNHAKLPTLPPDDYGRLVRARVNLMWAGRYPAPNRDEDGERDEADLWEHAYERLSNFALLRKPHSFGLDDVKRIYSIANDCFWSLRHTYGV
ncbi:hypothetical protein SAMN05216337_1002349 [Bradyrhizobium brasilense]|uniref:HEPN domain-containing protein n=1 Tax=Bradyrhizobium brasilense TaxID=1419277 RepID=A0A1G6L6N0_9BRAD|nr:hypothetical protein [Bradyrhizobium brasilense]SDC38979.1 hypothetical protein SAMN05216337_1002349 [Bradyrhizobium brasilense]